jgi:hypothetical protein
MIEDAAEEAFWSDGYRIVDALVTPDQCAFLRQAMRQSRDAGMMQAVNRVVYGGPHNQYAPILGQMFLG